MTESSTDQPASKVLSELDEISEYSMIHYGKEQLRNIEFSLHTECPELGYILLRTWWKVALCSGSQLTSVLFKGNETTKAVVYV